MQPLDRMERRELQPVAGRGELGEPIVGVVGGDASLRALVTATLQLGGAAHVVPATDRAWVQSELADGRLQRVVLLGGAPPTDFAEADHARLVWYQLEPGSACPPGVTSLAWPAPLDDLVAATLGVAPRPRPPTWSTQAFGVVAPRLVGLLAALRPSLRIIFSGDAGDAALCAAGGRVRAMAFGRLLDLEPLREDPALSLLLGLHARGSQRGRDLEADLAFVCENAEVFSGAEVYQHHAARVMAWITGHPIHTLRFAHARQAPHGLDLREVLRASLATFPDARLDLLAGRRPADSDARDAGVARSHDARVGMAVTALTQPLWLNVESFPIPRSPLAPRVGTRSRPRTGQRCRVPTIQGVSIDGILSNTGADPQLLLAALATARDRMEEHGRVFPLPGTRFVPVGKDLGDLLLFYRVGQGPLGDTFVGALRGARGVPIPVAVRQLGRPGGASGTAQADTLLAEIGRARSLRHANVARVLGVRRVAGSDLVVTELVHGLSVAELLRDLDALREPLPSPLATWIAARVGLALEAAAHHRDADGRPLLLADDDDRPEAVLVGFRGEVKLDVPLALAWNQLPAGAPPRHGELAADVSLAAALHRTAEPGVLGSEPTAWLAGAVELTLRLVQRNEAYALNLMQSCAAHILRLRMAVKSDRLREPR